MKLVTYLGHCLVVAALILTSCSPRVETTDGEPVSGGEIVIDHAYGQTKLMGKPSRVATIAWGNHDLALALGVIPVGISKANYGVSDGSGILPWTKDAFTKLGVASPNLFDDVAGLDYEAIADAKPDVILAAYSGITQEEYDLLSQIAPVVAFPRAPWQTYWREQITINARGMGMEAEGKELVQNLEALIKEKLQGHPELQGKSAAFFYFSPANLSSFYVYLPGDPRAAFLQDLGFVVPPSVEALAKEEKNFAISLSSEKVDILADVDLMITYGNKDLLGLLQRDPLIGTLPAIKAGAVAVIEDNTPLAASGTPSALSIPATIDEYLTLLSAATAQIQ